MGARNMRLALVVLGSDPVSMIRVSSYQEALPYSKGLSEAKRLDTVGCAVGSFKSSSLLSRA